MNNNKVTIVLPTYNGGTRGKGVFLKKAIESVLEQSYRIFELIIINDGSTDTTEQICKSYSDQRIKYIYQKNKGLSAARNIGMKKSTGNFITFLDDDDIFYKDKLKRQIEYFMNNENVDVLYSFANRINIEDKIINTLSYNYTGNITKRLLKGNIINSPASIMITKRAIDSVGFFKEYLKSSEDLDYWLRLSSKYSFFCIEEYLVGYRIHSSQMNHNREKMEFYDFIVLMENLMDLNVEDKDKYLHNLYMRFTKIDYGVRDLDRFRRNYKIASTYAPHSIEWILKYWISYFPSLLNGVYFLYDRIKK